MKKYSLIKFASLIILLMAFQVSMAQENPPAQPKEPDKLEIIMKIDYSKWKEGYRYEALTFFDTDSVAEAKRKKIVSKDKDSVRRGRAFKSAVKRKQRINWKAEFTNKDDGKNKNIVLINVISNPKNAGTQILNEPWYTAIENGKRIEGQCQTDFDTDAEERYVISFAIMDKKGNWISIYTVDPILKGSQ